MSGFIKKKKGKASPEEQVVQLNSIVSVLKELEEDVTVPRNVKLKLQKTVVLLREEKEVSMRIDRALQELDEIGEDTNLQPYIRTQIWNVVSLLEKI
jgi:uncharacterized protein (UPF0147 family)